MTLPIAREYPGGASVQTLIGSVLGPVATSCTMSGNAGWTTGASGPFAVVINKGGANEEKCLVSAQSASSLTFSARGYDGTTAQTHQVGETIQPCLTATDLAEANQHTSSVSGVHGLTTAVVGLGDVQTLSNKTLDASTVIIPGTTVTAVTFVAGWTNYNAALYASAGWTKDPTGWINLQGLVWRASTPSTPPSAILTGLAPTRDGLIHFLGVRAENGTGALIDCMIDGTGTLTANSGIVPALHNLSLDGLRYQS